MFGESWTTSLNSWYTIVCRGVCLFFQIFWTLPENVYVTVWTSANVVSEGDETVRWRFTTEHRRESLRCPLFLYILINVIQFLYLLYVCCRYGIENAVSLPASGTSNLQIPFWNERHIQCRCPEHFRWFFAWKSGKLSEWVNGVCLCRILSTLGCCSLYLDHHYFFKFICFFFIPLCLYLSHFRQCDFQPDYIDEITECQQ